MPPLTIITKARTNPKICPAPSVIAKSALPCGVARACVDDPAPSAIARIRFGNSERCRTTFAAPRPAEAAPNKTFPRFAADRILLLRALGDWSCHGLLRLQFLLPLGTLRQWSFRKPREFHLHGGQPERGRVGAPDCAHYITSRRRPRENPRRSPPSHSLILIGGIECEMPTLAPRR